MLFMPMIEAAPRAAAIASGERCAIASAAIAAATSGLRAVVAAASAVPHACCGVRTVEPAIAPRLMRRSRACSGRRSFSLSIDMTVLSRCGERLLALLPVARAELVGLQGVEDAQHLGGIAADAEIVDRDE